MAHLIDNQQHLAEWVRNQRDNIDIAVAFWGDGAIEMLGLSPERAFRILLDLGTGGTNPNEVRKLLKIAPKSVRCVDRLHAKAYIAEKELVVGSANASANGLGLEGGEATRWHELGLRTDDVSAVKEAKGWFDRQWRSAKLIDDEMLQAAEKAWKNRQRTRPMSTAQKKTNLLEAVRANPSEFTNRRIWVTVIFEDLSKEARKELKEIKKEIGYEPLVFEDWSSMPVNAKLVCFTRLPDANFEKYGNGILFTGEQKQRGNLKSVTPSDIFGYKIGPISTWRKLLKRAEATDPKAWKRDKCLFMDLAMFVDRYGEVIEDLPDASSKSAER
ncbi:phospholipase D family protein [Acidithiobacillus sp.]|uniref:phospholipase D family protein n=1 Tax=Acidithiobacillus sp. TaxID=1872118 RepID=UPI00230D7131|nr:phospholipase D family protein [Acidithiobacillus sp.]MDA8246102.1 phospholipase D family protein [Acidithiobacillus sp.]